MRIIDTGTSDFLATRGGLVAHQLVWISARNIASGLVEGLGLWTGDDDLAITIDGAARTYTGAGGLLDPEAITAGPGLEVRATQVRLSAVAPEVEGLVMDYDTRFAPAEIHRAVFDPATRALVGAPHRLFRGLCNGVEFPVDPAGGAPACVVELVSETRALTRTLATKKSDASQALRAGDRFRRYGDISGGVPVYWGEKRHDAAAPAEVARVSPRSGGGGQ